MNKQLPDEAYQLIAEAWRLMDAKSPKSVSWHLRASKFLNADRTTIQAMPISDAALPSLAAEPAGWQAKKHGGNWVSIKEEHVEHYRYNEDVPVRMVYTPPPLPVSMKDHQLRELVNGLCDIAATYQGTQQLREWIARAVRAALNGGGAS